MGLKLQENLERGCVRGLRELNARSSTNGGWASMDGGGGRGTRQPQARSRVQPHDLPVEPGREANPRQVGQDQQARLLRNWRQTHYQGDQRGPQEHDLDQRPVGPLPLEKKRAPQEVEERVGARTATPPAAAAIRRRAASHAMLADQAARPRMIVQAGPNSQSGGLSRGLRRPCTRGPPRSAARRRSRVGARRRGEMRGVLMSSGVARAGPRSR